MIDRRRAGELIQRYDIPKATIAICAGVDSSQVTNYFKGARVSSNVETAVGRAVEQIVAVIDRAKPIRPDVCDGAYMKDLIRRWREDGCFVVMIGGSQTLYFVRNNGRLTTTRFLLQTTALTNELAETVAERLRAEGYQASVLENPYGSIDTRYDDLQEVWPGAALTATQG